jgi:hypothetical protein
VLFADAGNSVLPSDIIDAGNTATPPTDIYDAMVLMAAQVTTGMLNPTFNAVGTAEAINPGPGQTLIVRVGGTATTVTVQVPGLQPYTGIDRADASTGSISNTDRQINVSSPVLVEPIGDAVVVLYSQTTAVTAALVQVG